MTDTEPQSSSASNTEAVSQGRWESLWGGFIRPEFKKSLIKLLYSAKDLPAKPSNFFASEEECTESFRAFQATSRRILGDA